MYVRHLDPSVLVLVFHYTDTHLRVLSLTLTLPVAHNKTLYPSVFSLEPQKGDVNLMYFTDISFKVYSEFGKSHTYPHPFRLRTIMEHLSRECKNSNLLELKRSFSHTKKSPPPNRKSRVDHRGMSLDKWRSGLDDTPSTVEIMQELSDDIQPVFDSSDEASVDHIYNRMVRQMEMGVLTQASRDHTVFLPPRKDLSGRWQTFVCVSRLFDVTTSCLTDSCRDLLTRYGPCCHM